MSFDIWVYFKNEAHCSMFCCVHLTPTLQGYFTGTGAIIWLPSASEAILQKICNMSQFTHCTHYECFFHSHFRLRCYRCPILWGYLSYVTLCCIYHRTGSILIHVMNCCLTAPSHHLNQCWPHQWDLVAFIWEQFHTKCSRYLALIQIWKLII